MKTEKILTTLQPAPAQLADAASAQPWFGRYLGTVADTRTAQWDGSCGLLSRRRSQRKAWIFLGAFSPRFMIGFAIVDSGYVALAFAYVYDREGGRLIEEKLTLPLGFPRNFACALHGDWTLSRGARRWQISWLAEGWQAQLSSPRLTLDLLARETGNGMTTIAASPQRSFNSTYKDCSLDFDATLVIDGERHQITAPGMIDYTIGYPPRRTYWNWAAVNGHTKDGQRFGLNLVAHFNNGLENALWIGDRLIPLGQASFIYDAADLNRPWRIVSADGVVELQFQPEGQRSENLNAAVLASRFVQLFGRYEGLLLLDGQAVAVSGHGVTEQHLAVW